MPRFAASDGVRIHYEEAGRGRPVVFVHGWMMSGRFWHKQLEGLAGERRAIAIDLRGCGDSEARAGTHHMDRFADDLGDLFDALGLADVTLVGWSMGGGIAMHYLDRRGPGRVRAIGLVDFPPRYTEDRAVTEKVIDRLHAEREAFFGGFLKRMFLRDLAPADEAWIKAEVAKCDTEIGCEMYRQLPVGSSVGKSYDLPALLVFPRDGWFTKSLDAWRGIFPRHEAPPFEASRHCPFWEEPQAFNRAVLALGA